MGGKDGGRREVLRELTGEALEGERWRTETTHMQQVRFIRNTRFQGYPTIIPQSSFPFLLPQSTTMANDNYIRFPGPSLYSNPIFSFTACWPPFAFQSSFRPFIYSHSFFKACVIGTYKFSLRFCWLYYTYIQPRLPLTFKYFSTIKVLPIPPPLFSPDCCVFVSLCLTLVCDVDFLSG